MSSAFQFVDGFGDVAIPGPKGDTGDVTAEAQEAATQAASSASAAQTAAAASAASAQLAADVSATVKAQRLAKIVPGRGNPMGTTLPGGITPADSRFIIQAGSATAPTNAAGDFSFNWPEKFPTAILSVQLTSGDSTAHSGTLALRPVTTLTTCQGNAAGNTSGAVRCDFIAIGY